MSKSIISQGNTTTQAIENGLKELKVSKDKVEIKILEEEKRSFFNILAPRVVKVELTLKEDKNEDKKNNKKIELLSTEEQVLAFDNLDKFLKEFIKNLPEDTTYRVEKNSEGLKVFIENKDLGYLIGYRGETLYSLQNIMAAIASKGLKHRVRVILDIEGYKEKREKTLQELAEKMAKRVVRTRKSVTLEPMQAYERKIIHSYLQENDKVETRSVGEEPHRRLIISLKKDN